ncbi:ribosome maturation factor RimM [Limoniibacter endophyticus]|uniref:Ribosome maturation factor RimM n=1 Tax=Limoniibacter endophyticus TaxID=1565040 RepID=A0A8J3DPJ6_9HYPH|nr:ribosome maturation factor RimM [Limoniibacter endophyticus]GHC74150.1 ribosome maturation factor RimM [Limoniibacter endophyticus]
MSRLENPVQMALVGAAHGIKGEVRVRSFTGEPLALADYGPLFDQKGKSYTIKTARPQKDMLVVRFNEIADRTAAEALNGTALFVERSALPDDLEEDEFYYADLIGLTCIDETGDRFGKVLAVQDFGGGDLLEISQKTGGSAFVPFTSAAVPNIDLKKGEVLVDRQAAGLLDDGRDPDEAVEIEDGDDETDPQ